MNENMLVQSVAAADFLSNMGLPTPRKLHLGDPAKLPRVASHIQSSHDAMADGIKTLGRIAHDKTRSEPEKHETARVLAGRLLDVLTNSQNAITNAATALDSEIDEAIATTYAPKEGRSSLESEMRQWMRETAKTPEGMAQIKQAVLSNFDFASIMVHSPAQLLGLSEERRIDFAEDAIKKHTPDIDAAMSEACHLRDLAKRYPQVIRSVKASFYNNAIAEQAKSRVEL